MPYEFISALEVTYGHALAGGGNFHRVTTAAGNAAELAPATFLWYRRSTSDDLKATGTPTTSARKRTAAATTPRAIVHVHVAPGEAPKLPPAPSDGEWLQLDKPLDRQQGLYLWYLVMDWRKPSDTVGEFTPLKEIRVVSDPKDVPEGFECVVDSPVVTAAADAAGNHKESRAFICLRRLDAEDLAGTRWSIVAQKVGTWVDVRDLASNRWHVGQIISISATECRLQITMWRKHREEVVAFASGRARVAKLGTHTNIYLSPAFPYCRKQGAPWNLGLKDLAQMRREFDEQFFDSGRQFAYVQRRLLPAVEKMLTSMFFSNELAEEVNGFHQHAIKNIVAWFLGCDISTQEVTKTDVLDLLLGLVRMVLSGVPSCMFFYLKYGGAYSSMKSQNLVYTTYLTTSDALATIPSRHPARSFYYVENIDHFFQAGGLQVILQRLNHGDVNLTELAVYSTVLLVGKPCLIGQKRRRTSSASGGRRKAPSSPEASLDEFFRDFLIAALERLRKMTQDELKDEDGIIDHIVTTLESLYRDWTGLEDDVSTSDTGSVDGALSPTSPMFAEMLETFYLDLSKRFICCPFLSQRLQGLSRLSDLICMAQRKDSLLKKSSFNLKRSSSAATINSSTSELPVTVWLRSKHLVEWLASSEVIEVILGDEATCVKCGLRGGVHLELIKRSRGVLEFATNTLILNEAHISLLWNAATAQLHSGRKTIFEVLLGLCQDMSPDLLEIVMGHATQVPVERYDDLLIMFVHRLVELSSKCLHEGDNVVKKSLSTLAALRVKRSHSSSKDPEVHQKVIGVGLSVLATAARQCTEDQMARIASAFADTVVHVQTTLAHSGNSSSTAKEMRQLVQKYLSDCINSINTGRQVEVSMMILQKVIDGFGGRSSGMHSNISSVSSALRNTFQTSTSASLTPANELIRSLETQYSLLSVVIKELKRCVSEAHERGSHNPPLPPSNSPGRHKHSSYRSSIDKRLEFLGYLVTTAPMELSFEDAEELWRCLAGDESTVDERDAFYEWLSSVIADPLDFVQRAYSSKNAFSQSATTAIFHELIRRGNNGGRSDKSTSKWIRLNFATMNNSSFWAFEKLFRYVNAEQKRLSSTSCVSQYPHASSILVAESIDLIGMDILMDIALSVESEHVSSSAISYIIHLHLNVGSKLVKREIWTDFMQSSFQRLQKCVSLKQSREIRRCLTILNTFLWQFKAIIRDIGLDDGGSDHREHLTVYVRTQDGRVAAPFLYKLRRTVLVGELRDIIARDCDHPASRVRIVTESKVKLTAQGHDRVTLEKAHVFRSHSSTVTGSAKVAVATDKRPSYVEAILLGKVETDTNGHIERHHDGVLLSSASDWDLLSSDTENHFALLLSLLSYNDGISEEAWKLLKMMDTNKSAEKQIRYLSDTLSVDGSIRRFPKEMNWDLLLDSTCPPRLLYNIEIVERCAMGAVLPESRAKPSSSEEVDDKIQVNIWSMSFVRLGGLCHLEEFVLRSKPRHVIAQGALSMICYARVLKLVSHFMNCIAEKDRGTRTDAVDHIALKVHLLDTIHSLQGIEDVEAALPLAKPDKTLTLQVLPQDNVPIIWYPSLPLNDPDNKSDATVEAHLTARVLDCLGACITSRTRDENEPSTVEVVEKYPNGGATLLKCIVHSRVVRIRTAAVNVIVSASGDSNHDANDRMHCRRHFLSLMATIEHVAPSDDFYRLYEKLVVAEIPGDDLSWFEFLPACAVLSRHLKAYTGRSHAPSIRKSSPATSAGNAVDELLQSLLSCFAAVLKQIPPILAGKWEVPSRGRSLREVVVSRLHSEEGIIAELFNECLFATAGEQDHGCDESERSAQYFLKQPKCKSETTRKIAFDLLKSLSFENVEGLRYLFTRMAVHHNLEPPPDTIAHSTVPLSSKKKRGKSRELIGSTYVERGKYLGLKNLGCTCYLNSTIQAFFMIPKFRRQILRYQSKESGLVYQLQSVFAHLEGSAKPYFNPKALTMAMKTWEGESIDVNQQQDASEFLTSFFQQLESEMNDDTQGGNSESILGNSFGGMFSNELVAEGSRYSERFEPFHFISVPVRDRKNLIESLNSWVEGDKVSYTWETPSKDENDEAIEKVTLETHKRISISKLPDQLIIHLKRFEFDFETMQQIKLHDRFEFPMELDMFPYTKEGQEAQRKQDSGSGSANFESEYVSSSSRAPYRPRAPEYYKYELVGTVVHMGSAHSGHYYSFLREHQSLLEHDAIPEWFEFNDTHVKPFDASELPDECFGGDDGSRKPSATSSGTKKKNRSSFMLIYSRVEPIVQDLATGSAKSPVRMITAAIMLVFINRLRIRAGDRIAKVRQRSGVIAPEPIRAMIAVENQVFWRKTYLYNHQCLSFTLDLIKSCMVSGGQVDGTNNPQESALFEPIEVRLEALQLATKFVFGTLWQTGNVAAVLKWKPVLCTLYRDEVRGSQWLLSTLSDKESLLFDLLAGNENDEVRELVAIVLAEAIATTSHHAAAQEVDDGPRSGNCSELEYLHRQRRKSSSSTLPPSFEFIFLLFRLLPRLLTVPARQHREYFTVLLDFALSGHNECAFTVVNSVVGAIVSLLTGLATTQPLLQSELKRVKGRTILKRIELDPVILKLLSLLIRCGPPPGVDVKDAVIPSHLIKTHAELTATDHDMILNERFITLLTQRANHYTKETKPLEQVIMHLCWESRQMTKFFIDTIMKGVEIEDHDDVKAYFRTLNTIFKVRDSLADERVEDAMTKLVAILASQQRYYKATEVSIDMLTRLSKRHNSVVRWLRANASSCNWIEKWLLAHRGADGLLQQQKTLLVKPNSTSSWGTVNVRSDGLVRSIDRSISKLLPRIRSILDPSATPETFYDSDDNPVRLVGKRVRVKWAKEKWYEGVVERFHEETYEHFVNYDDGDQRQYRMSDKMFYVVESSPSNDKEGGNGSTNTRRNTSSRRRQSSSPA